MATLEQILLATSKEQSCNLPVLQTDTAVMQQPKLFYQQHDTYGHRSLDQTDSQSNRPFQTFVLPDNPALVGKII